MKIGEAEPGRDDVGSSSAGLPVERRLEAAEQLCRELRQRVGALEREREQVRGRLEAILRLLDGVGPR
jgi:hypothetical protein